MSCQQFRFELEESRDRRESGRPVKGSTESIKCDGWCAKIIYGGDLMTYQLSFWLLQARLQYSKTIVLRRWDLVIGSEQPVFLGRLNGLSNSGSSLQLISYQKSCSEVE